MKKNLAITSIFMILFFISIVSCNKTDAARQEEAPVDSAATVRIDLSAPLKYCDGLKSKSIIHFDEDCENIMGMPHNIEVRGDSIFAIDAFQSPGIYIYGKDGRQLMAYCKVGTGPGDITSPSCLAVTDTEISTFDTASGKIVVIDKSGNYRRSVDVSLLAKNAILDKGDEVWIDYTNQQYETTRLAWRKDSLSECKEVLTVPDFAKGIVVIEMQALQKSPEGKVSYLPVMEPKIYTLADGGASVRYNLDFGQVWPDDATMKKDYTGNDWLRKTADFPIQSMQYHESGRYLVLGFRYEDKPYVTIYDKKSGKAQTYEFDKDIYGGSKYVTDSDLYVYRSDNNIEVFSID